MAVAMSTNIPTWERNPEKMKVNSKPAMLGLMNCRQVLALKLS
jgi:hypothetical protein